MAPKAHPERKEMRAHKVSRETKVRRDLQEPRDCMDQRDYQVWLLINSPTMQ